MARKIDECDYKSKYAATVEDAQMTCMHGVCPRVTVSGDCCCTRFRFGEKSTKYRKMKDKYTIYMFATCGSVAINYSNIAFSVIELQPSTIS